MNYFSHGRVFIDQPYFLAGTAIPDWLQVSDRHVRVRPRHAEPFVEDADPCMAAVVRGVLRHHADDAWFHNSATFYELSTELTGRIRAVLPVDGGFRASFLGHILVELLLDDALIAAEPARLDAYYQAVGSVEPDAVARAVERMSGKPPERLAWFIRRFCEERFLSDYADDGKLLFRLNQVMRRVQLPPLPEAFLEVLPPARELVGGRRDALINPDGTAFPPRDLTHAPETL